ncbi:YggS family pyridoxal phosphate-dependent enzyme [Thermovorax subterraneus]|nr:YggS family pyridoxal phosphate-dependent enzyme [Thermovorax subterraneus]
MEFIRKNIETLRLRVKEAAEKSGRREEDIKIVAVTKTVMPETIQVAVDCGLTILGENRVQEAQRKIELVKGDVSWHMIGHLQKNKVKYAVRLFSMIQSVDSYELAVEIDKRAGKFGKVMDVLVQVNIGKEETKFGAEYEETPELIKKISELENIRVKGLMAIAPFKEDPEDVRPFFRKMRELFLELKNLRLKNVEMEILSMGMTHDFHVAIEEGANMIRIGSGIFGPRI